MIKRATILVLLFIAAVVCSSVQVGAQLTPVQKRIIFRDDDVAPGGNNATLKAVNDVHIDENVPVTLGIIPHPNNGGTDNQLLEDTGLHDYLQSIAANPLFEFALHGYTHRDDGLNSSKSEFYGRSYADQYEVIKKGRDDIQEAFGVVPTTFIPPFDKGDSNTIAAAKALGFTDYCTGPIDYRMLVGYGDGIRVEPALTIGAVNYTVFANTIQDAKNKTDQFLSDPQSGDTLVIAYHYWQFSGSNGTVDSRKVKLLGDFIDYLRNRGDVTFGRLDRSSWVRAEAAESTSTSTYASAPVLINARSGSILFIFCAAATVFGGLYWSVGRFEVEKR